MKIMKGTSTFTRKGFVFKGPNEEKSALYWIHFMGLTLSDQKGQTTAVTLFLYFVIKILLARILTKLQAWFDDAFVSRLMNGTSLKTCLIFNKLKKCTSASI